ncbi:hypothetical protein HPB47_008722 [Ixodes persulcatus]|uniref:Uncharacterized protein n=1 Tax=Ixodes persulcatus TaxID=34615 RepID=A0AC60P400_IXOPE|nr:hypothetical protein HPB47_008722 [Ixodes persulcatus]
MLASPEDEPSIDDERPTTVAQLKSCFQKSGIDVDSPCTATSASDSTSHVGQCWVVRSLDVWNRFLHANGIELLEDLPNRLKVQTFVSYPLRDKDYHAVSAFLVSRLLNDHSCVHSVELNHVSTLFGRETQAFDNVATNQGIQKITLADEGKLQRKSKLKAHKLISALVGGNLRSIRFDSMYLFNIPRKALCDALANSFRLVELFLCDNGLTADGTIDILSALMASTTLTCLSLDNNNVASRVELETVLAHLVAVRQLSHVVQFHPTLRRLSVKNVRPHAIGDMAQLFTALICNTTLQELEARGLQSVNEIECLASLIARTSSIRLLTLDVCPSCTDYLVIVMRGLSQNNSIWRFDCSIKKLTVPLSEEIAYMLTKNSTLSHLLLNDALAGENCLMTLANAMDLNRSLQQLGVTYPTVSFAGICIRGCLRRNASVMARAVDFAVRKAADKKSAQAFELHQKNEHFIQKLTLVAGTGPQAESLIADANRHIRHNFFALAEIVKEGLVCLDFPDSECATGINQLNQYCLLEIVSYLKISDVKD